MFIRLNNFIHLIKGKYCTLYDTRNNKAYLLDEKGSNLILYLEENQPIEEFIGFDTEKIEIKRFMNNLQNLDLIIKTDKRYFIDKYYDYSKVNPQLIFEPSCEKVYLQLTNDCNLKCMFCNNKEYKIWNGCSSCILTEQSEEDMDLDTIDSLILDLSNFKINEFIIQGGNPLLKSDMLLAVIDKIRIAFPTVNIEIITNGSGIINIDLLKKFKKIDGISITVMLFDSYDHFTTDVFTEQLKYIQLINNYKIPIKISLIHFGGREVDKRVDSLCKDLNCNLQIINAINLKEKAHLDENINAKTKYIVAPSDSKEFFIRQKINTCMIGNIFINIKGDVKPCHYMESKVGNIHNNTLINILSNKKLYEHWFKTKDSIEICKECSMRYFCVDCSVFEESPKLHNLYCSYNKNNLKIICRDDFISQIKYC